MSVNLRIKSVNLVTTTVSCHESVQPAYTFSKCLKTQMYPAKFGNDFVAEAQSLEPLHVIKTPDKSLRFFAGWAWLDRCRLQNQAEIIVVEHIKFTPEYVRKMGWLYLFSMHAFDLERKSNLSQLTDIIDQIPRDLRGHLLATQSSYSPHVTVQNLTGETRSAIRNQLKSSDKKSSAERISVLDSILGER